ncbi:MAG: hypothetical protein ACHQ2Y_07330, partial [Candidatus Lutacidiplasmatales archaeon]
MIPLDFGLGLASGLAVAAVLYLMLWWWARRASSAPVSYQETPQPPEVDGGPRAVPAPSGPVTHRGTGTAHRLFASR